MTEAGKLPRRCPHDSTGSCRHRDAEKLLEAQPLGCFLIRVSHSHVGYTLSYKARSCCRHVMVKLLDDGSFVIPGEERAHASLDALVAFHQQQPGRLHGEWLTQPCGQKDPANVDYEDLFLYSNALVEESASPAHGPGKHQNAPSCPVASPGEASAKPVLLHRPKERTPSAEMHRAPTEEATSSCPLKAPLEKACRKLWKNLKTVPQTGKRVQQQLKSHLEATSLSSLWDPGWSPGTHSTRAPAGDAAWEVNAHVDPFVPQALRDRGDSSRKASRSASWSEVTPSVGGWHQVVLRTLSSRVSKPEPRDLAEAQKDWLPEEYCPPPPFAPGYC